MQGCLLFYVYNVLLGLQMETKHLVLCLQTLYILCLQWLTVDSSTAEKSCAPFPPFSFQKPQLHADLSDWIITEWTFSGLSSVLRAAEGEGMTSHADGLILITGLVDRKKTRENIGTCPSTLSQILILFLKSRRRCLLCFCTLKRKYWIPGL